MTLKLFDIRLWCLVLFCSVAVSTSVRASSDSHMIVPTPLSMDYLSDIVCAGIYRWPAAKMPIKICFQRDDKVSGYQPSLARTMAECLDEWVSASDGKCSWLETAVAGEADVIVRWTPYAVPKMQGMEVGQTKSYTRFNYATNRGRIERAEVQLASHFPNHEASPEEIRRSYLHEAGHVFGIHGHSHHRGDIMFYLVDEGPTSLSERDKQTIREVYNDNQLAVSSP